MIYLNSEEIISALSLKEIMDSVEEAYKLYEKKDYEMPSRIHVDHGEKETLLYMPCFAKGLFGTKMLTGFETNAEKGLPVIDGLMVLNDGVTGKPVCIMDAKSITMLRTGAIGGLGVKYTTPENIRTLGLVGTGVQGFYQVVYACMVRNIKKVYLFNRNEEKAFEFAERLQRRLGNIEIHVMNSIRELVEASEVIITATTSEKPVIPADAQLLKGKHFIAIGSYKPFVREFPDELFTVVDKVYADIEFAKEESGDLCIPIEKGLIHSVDIKTFGKLVTGEIPFEESSKGTTFFKSVGMALFDIITAEKIYKRAVEEGMGTNLKL